MAKDPKDIQPVDPQRGVAAVNQTMKAFLGTADVNRAFGDPIEHDGRLIIPTSEVLVGMGFGLGFGSGPVREEDEGLEQVEKGEGGGGGGGGRTLSRPVAVIVAEPEGVRVEPVIDLTKLGVTVLTALGAVALAATKMLKRANEAK